VAALLASTATLAVTSLVTDSVTFDETSHLTAGMSYLKTGDFRMAPDHPPLPKLWCAWPLLLVKPHWPECGKYWQDAQVFDLGRVWLFQRNDGQRLVVIGRCMMVVLLLATAASTYAVARRLFGGSAGLLALALAALSPTLLAHGRLITTDLPITLCGVLVLLTFARLMQQSTWPRLIAAALALSAASVTKMSWPLLLPALLAMAAWAIFGPRPAASGRRRERAAMVAGSLLLMAMVTWAGIWTCYGWRSSITAPLPAGASQAAYASLEQTTQKLARQWYRALSEPNGNPRGGLVATLLRWAADQRALPDAYLLGLAQTLESTSARTAYLMGEYSNTGWRVYFPLALAIKTPLATLLLVLAGLAALIRRRARVRDPVLMVGLVAFAVVYWVYVIGSRFNIGHRHLLPVYPVLFVLAGAAAAWASGWIGRVLLGGALLWLLTANVRIHPHYLAYFNELIGGPSNGHKYLADSNIDWGQDLLRLADYARGHPGQPIKLAYFGSAQPTYYLDCTALPSHYPFEPRTELTPGTYVVSLTQLLGVYDVEIRDAFWNDRFREAYRTLGQIVGRPPNPDDPPQMQAQRVQAAEEYRDLREKRLLNRLAHRQSDARVGYSLFLYRLTEADIEELTRP
jgi:4-amino-4-deoxy-L-arabinose transferase-like glycosyltransferase